MTTRPAPRMDTLQPPASHRAPATLPAEVVANDNPHCRQLLCRHALDAQGDRVPVVPLGETAWALGDDSPQIDYEQRDDKDRSPLHFGQLKLLLSMLTFLLWHTEASDGAEYCLIYAGAAPGNSAAYLARRFPAVTFYLFDPAPFCDELLRAPPANVRLFNEYFTDDVAAAFAERFAGERTLFVSDIRTGKTEDCVVADMGAQRRWALAIGAEVSMVKFRLPWDGGRSSYLGGTVTLQAFATLTSTETRLITTRAELAAPRDYDHRAYERQLAYHNLLGRVRYHSHSVTAEGLDHCYDCAVLVLVGKELLRRETGTCADGEVAAWVAETVAALNSGRTLGTEYAVSSTRRESRGKGRARRGRGRGR